MLKALLAEEISTIEEQPSTWHQPVRKALRVFQELERLHSSRLLAFGKRGPHDILLKQGHLRTCFSRFLHSDTQRPWRSGLRWPGRC